MDEPSFVEPVMAHDGRNHRLIVALACCWERRGQWLTLQALAMGIHRLMISVAFTG